ncbi:MAG: replication initiation protein [Saprospiraceae bacterium]|nr:replication initiation protein [Saprospiraceae bacterium]
MSQKTKKNKGIKLIKKSNDLIEARYRFDIWETRVFTSILSEIEQSDEDFRVYRVYLRDIIKEFSINNGDAYELLRQATHSLMNKKLYVNYEQEGVIREKIYHIIRKADVMKSVLDESKRKVNEYVDISIDPEMKPLLLELKSRFTTYDLQNVVKFKSSYTLRIYEHLKQYEKIGKRTMDVEYLKRIFELTSEYPLFANFYQKVIEPAYRDINEFTDLTITNIEKIKEGKRVESLRFTFHSKSKELAKSGTRALLPPSVKPEKNELDTTEHARKDQLFLQFQSIVVGEFGVSPTVFLSELENCNEQRLEQAVRVTRRALQEGKLKNTSGFFIEALRREFTDPKEQQIKQKQSEANKKALIRSLEIQLEELKEQYKADINAQVRTLTESNVQVTLDAIEAVKDESKGYFALKGVNTDKLTLNDFREDKILRGLVILQIQAHNKSFFRTIEATYQPQIQAIEQELKLLKG